MALIRSLGSQLVAKATPGSASRDLAESQIRKPAIPGKGVPGTAARELVQEPTILPVPAGSEKIVSATPGVQGSEVVSPTAEPRLLAGGMGLPGGVPTTPPGVPGTGMFAGEPSRGVAPRSVSGGAAPGAKAAISQQSSGFGDIVTPAASYPPVQVQAESPQNASFFNNLPSTVGTLSGRASADQGGLPSLTNLTGKNTGQLAALGISTALQPINKVLGTNLGAGLRSYALSPVATRAGLGSITQSPLGDVARGLATTLRSAGDIGRAGVAKLRSLFGR